MIHNKQNKNMSDTSVLDGNPVYQGFEQKLRKSFKQPTVWTPLYNYIFPCQTQFTEVQREANSDNSVIIFTVPTPHFAF